MRAYGFSTGALALGDFARALEYLTTVRTDAIELSALRPRELVPLVDFARTADLNRYSFVSVHAPTGYASWEEPGITRHLAGFVERGWPIVVHPDAICRPAHWHHFGDLLYIENMDKRKPLGRSAAELRKVFVEFPNSGLCFDIAHARQFDSSMTEAFKILLEHGDRIQQVHISEVNTSSKHDRLSPTAIQAYRGVASLIPIHAPVILETPAQGDQIAEQLALAADALDVMPQPQPTSRLR
jgi:hypothetical protein